MGPARPDRQTDARAFRNAVLHRLDGGAGFPGSSNRNHDAIAACFEHRRVEPAAANSTVNPLIASSSIPAAPACTRIHAGRLIAAR